MPMTDAQLRDRLNTRKPPTGITFKSTILDVRSADGFVRVSYDVGPEYTNPMGALQGGIVSALIDDACAFAAIIKSGESIAVPSLEFKTTFLAAAKPGIVFVEARCIKMGRTACFMEGELQDADGQVLAKMSVTGLVRYPKSPQNLVESKG
ncbi:MAG: PaaI family thioesterase [Sphingomonadaceae bacterium]